MNRTPITKKTHYKNGTKELKETIQRAGIMRAINKS